MPPPPLTDEAIARALQRTPLGSDAMSLARALRVQQHQLMDRLLAMQQQGLAQLIAGRWRWAGGALPAAAGAPRFGPGAGATATPMRPPGRWAMFRQLCRYYLDAIHHEDRGEITLVAGPQSPEYREVTQPPDWSALECGQEAPIVVPSFDGDFREALRNREQAGPWLLCAAIDAVPQQDGTVLLHPLVLAPVKITSRDGSVLQVRAEGPVDINHGWRRDRRNAAVARANEDLLAALHEAVQSHGTQAGAGPAARAALPACAVRRACAELQARRPNQVREPLRPDQPAAGTPLQAVHRRGVYNRVLLVAPRTLKYTASLAKELQELANPDKVADDLLDGTALAAIFPHEPRGGAPTAAPAPPPATPPPIAEDSLLNEEQRAAIHAAATARLTVLTGPPGTGKSTTVAHGMLHLARSGRPVLMASRNHQAIEAVEPRLNNVVQPDLVVLRPAMRRNDPGIPAWQAAMTELLARAPAADSATERDRAAQRLTDALERRARAETELGRLLDLGDDLARAEAALRERTAATRTAPPARTDLAALPPPDAVAGAAAALAATLVQRPWWQRALRAVALAPLRLLGRDPRQLAVQRCAGLLATFAQHGCRFRPTHALAQLAEDLLEAQRLADAGAAARAADDLVHRIEAMRSRAELDAGLGEAIDAVHARTREWLRAFARAAGSAIAPATKQRFQALRAGLANHERDELAGKFESALRAAKAELLQHFPMWAVSNLSARKATPLQAGAFDLLILDEASQCDIPSVVPLLYRAKRALIVGDPMQLGHISQLSAATDLRLREQHGVAGALDAERFSARTNSMFALADSTPGKAAVMLRAHYRCHPDIAGYCNSAFYRGALRVMTNATQASLPGLPDAGGLQWTDVRGPTVAATTGCTRPAEVAAIADFVAQLHAAGFRSSLGVVTPFRAQAEAIRVAVANRLSGHELDAMRFRVHTVDGFQGDERDVMLFSPCGGGDMPAGALGFLARQRERINVAASRARRHLRVFGDRTWAASCGIAHIQDLLLACERAGAPAGGRPDLVGPVWEPRLADALRAAGLPIHQQFFACGHHIDIALLRDGRRLAVEVDGETWHQDGEGRRLVDDLVRDRVLRDAGWKVVRFWVHQLREDFNECVDTIRRTWDDPTAG